jgi:hypothetical protein
VLLLDLLNLCGLARGADEKEISACCSSARLVDEGDVPGSSNRRPIRRLSEPIVFLKLDVSAVLAASPRYR